MSYVDFEVFDADNHYYEAADALTRHVDKKMQTRCVQWAEVKGRPRILIGGRISNFIPNPNWDPIAQPGSLEDFFRGKEPANFTNLERLTDRPEYQDRSVRLKVMDEQGVESAFFFPTQGVAFQEMLSRDIGALTHLTHAFNQWLLEDWGFGADGRIYGCPLLSFSDPEACVSEIDWCLENGARVFCALPGPVQRGDGTAQAPSMPDYDPIWQRLNDAKVPLALHGGDSGFDRLARENWEPDPAPNIFHQSAFGWYFDNSMQTSHTFAAMLCHQLFDRFPNLRLLSVENSSSWIAPMLDSVRTAMKKAVTEFSEDPREVFKRHVWVSPNYEDSIDELRDLIGVDRIIFGSDWPHAEGLDEPTKYYEDIKGFASESEVRQIMYENAASLVR